jgi:hypothetical protein
MINELEQMQSGEDPLDPEAALDEILRHPQHVKAATFTAPYVAAKMADELDEVASDIEGLDGDASRIRDLVSRFRSSNRIVQGARK